MQSFIEATFVLVRDGGIRPEMTDGGIPGDNEMILVSL